MFARPNLLFCAALLVASVPSWAANKVDLDYHVRFLPQSDQAEVRLTLEQGSAVRSLRLELGDQGRYSDFQGDGQWQQEAPGSGTWRPAAGKSSLSYRVRVSHVRASGRFDARMTEHWALLRGDDLVPSAHLVQQDGVELVARLEFELPEGWQGVETGWPRIGKNRFRIDNPARLFDRPTGWLLAGRLGTRRVTLGSSEVSVAAPLGEGMRRMDILTLLTFVWDEYQAVFLREPGKLLVVGAGNPMWRGGLSASNSLYLHADRPLVSENGTSALLHELVHVFARIRDTDESDWISEGLAEYYAIELLRRAGGLGEDRYERIRQQLTRWSRKVKNLRGERVSGAATARAVLLLQALDGEIRTRSENRHSLDDVVRGLIRMERVNTDDFIAISENLMGGKSQVLDTPLLAVKARP
ncbi:M61 metallopeptidase family protein [Azotobacter armeniacus]